jgi:hypothetical protein
MTCKSVQIQVYTNIILSDFIYTICVCKQVQSNLVSGFAFHKQTKKLFDRFGTLCEHDLRNITDSKASDNTKIQQSMYLSF